MIKIYTDGSYNPVTNDYGAGAVILRDDVVVQEFSIPCPDKDYSKYRNVAGEVMGAMYALIWAQENAKGEEICLYHDYAGIGLWPTGKWSANNLMTISYAEFVRKLPFKVKFVQVRGHSGNQWNDRADALARKAAGLK